MIIYVNTQYILPFRRGQHRPYTIFACLLRCRVSHPQVSHILSMYPPHPSAWASAVPEWVKKPPLPRHVSRQLVRHVAMPAMRSRPCQHGKQINLMSLMSFIFRFCVWVGKAFRWVSFLRCLVGKYDAWSWRNFHLNKAQSLLCIMWIRGWC